MVYLKQGTNIRRIHYRGTFRQRTNHSNRQIIRLLLNVYVFAKDTQTWLKEVLSCLRAWFTNVTFALFSWLKFFSSLLRANTCKPIFIKKQSSMDTCINISIQWRYVFSYLVSCWAVFKSSIKNIAAMSVDIHSSRDTDCDNIYCGRVPRFPQQCYSISISRPCDVYKFRNSVKTTSM